MADPSAPRIVGRYALYEPFASGGMAQVHLGRLLGPVGFSRTVAIKRLHASFAEDPEFVAGFLDEARLASRVRHPNVVTTLDVVAEGRDALLVMEYVQGESLAYFFKRARGSGEPPLPLPLAAHVLAGVLHGLHAAHEARGERGEPLGLVHRDVSPHNILLGTDGLPRVVDFGVAKAKGRMQQTREGEIKGKIRYMAPEQMSGKGVTRSADIYAASVVLWEALTGRRLFQGESDTEVMYEVVMGQIPPPSSLVPGLPPAIEAIVLRGLRREPAERFATAEQMAIALEQAVAPVPASALGRWVAEHASDVLGRRAALVERIERDAVDAPSAATSSPRGPSGGAAVLVADALTGGSRTRARPGKRAALGRILAAAAAAGLVLGGGALVWLRAAPPPGASPVRALASTELTPPPPPAGVASPPSAEPLASGPPSGAPSVSAAPAASPAPPVSPRTPFVPPAARGLLPRPPARGATTVTDKDLVR